MMMLDTFMNEVKYIAEWKAVNEQLLFRRRHALTEHSLAAPLYLRVSCGESGTRKVA